MLALLLMLSTALPTSAYFAMMRPRVFAPYIIESFGVPDTTDFRVNYAPSLLKNLMHNHITRQLDIEEDSWPRPPLSGTKMNGWHADTKMNGWHEADEHLQSTINAAGYDTQDLKAILDEQKRLVTVRGSMVKPGLKQSFFRHIRLPFAVADPATVQLQHDQGSGLLTLRIPKAAKEVEEPRVLAITAIEPPSPRAQKLADPPPPPTAATSGDVEREAEDKFAFVTD